MQYRVQCSCSSMYVQRRPWGKARKVSKNLDSVVTDHFHLRLARPVLVHPPRCVSQASKTANISSKGLTGLAGASWQGSSGFPWSGSSDVETGTDPPSAREEPTNGGSCVPSVASSPLPAAEPLLNESGAAFMLIGIQVCRYGSASMALAAVNGSIILIRSGVDQSTMASFGPPPARFGAVLVIDRSFALTANCGGCPTLHHFDTDAFSSTL